MEYLSPGKAIILKNKTCPYCGIKLSDENTTKEHVIGRNFVPKGSLEKSWNLILYTCSKCNNDKSNLEDDISAITQINSPFVVKNPKFRNELDSKIKKSFSRRTGKTISESSEKIEIPVNYGSSVKMTFSLVTNPQINEERSNALALMHLMAFFYLLTYEEDKQIGHFWPGSFFCLKSSIRSDWGNEISKQYKALISNWEFRFNGIAAEDNFKCNIRKNLELECWSWALEWNQSLRLIGFFGKDESINEIVAGIKLPEPDIVLNGGRLYREKSLLDNEDDLFQDEESST